MCGEQDIRQSRDISCTPRCHDRHMFPEPRHHGVQPLIIETSHVTVFFERRWRFKVSDQEQILSLPLVREIEDRLSVGFS